MTWDGMERRRAVNHGNGDILPECHQIFKNINEKIDTLIDIDRCKNGKWDCHLAESSEYRTQVRMNREAIDSFKGTKRIAITTLVTVIIAIVTFAVAWGEMKNKVFVLERTNHVHGTQKPE